VEEALRRLADEQALRRLATLVARGVPQSDLFEALAEEVRRLLSCDLVGMARYESDDTMITVASAGGALEFPRRWALEDGDLAKAILATRRPARVDDWLSVPTPSAAVAREQLALRSSVASPILVDERVWGALFVNSTGADPLPSDTEARLESYSELVATAISNADARAEVARLAAEQAALRHVATLVARQASADDVFSAVAEQVAKLFGVESAVMIRYEADGSVTAVASSGRPGAEPGARLPLGGENIASLVLRTGRPARINDYSTATGALGALNRRLGVQAAVGSPIVVDGELWGAMIASSARVGSFPAETELRIGEFTELIATAISNIQARTELAASRARIAEAADEERQRVVRDLHDGAQSRLVLALIAFERATARRDLPPDVRSLIAEGLMHTRSAIDELRELSHGIHPAILTNGGLAAAVEVLADRAPVPVQIEIPPERYPPAVESAAYFVLAEALTNIAKHARASTAWVTVAVEGRTLVLEVRDDGVGGAATHGHGVVGMQDRLAALDGRLLVISPLGGGTIVAATIPLDGPPAASTPIP
jgi:signal transduction histidine kinase